MTTEENRDYKCSEIITHVWDSSGGVRWALTWHYMLWTEKFSKKMALRGLRMGLCAISGLCRVTLNVPLSTVSTTAGLSCGKKKKRERESRKWDPQRIHAAASSSWSSSQGQAPAPGSRSRALLSDNAHTFFDESLNLMLAEWSCSGVISIMAACVSVFKTASQTLRAACSGRGSLSERASCAPSNQSLRGESPCPTARSRPSIKEMTTEKKNRKRGKQQRRASVAKEGLSNSDDKALLGTAKVNPYGFLPWFIHSFKISPALVNVLFHMAFAIPLTCDVHWQASTESHISTWKQTAHAQCHVKATNSHTGLKIHMNCHTAEKLKHR